MPEVEYSTTMPLPRAAVWAFVKDMDNWAPFLTGYQKHEKLDETDSVWTLKGDVGILSRVVELRAHITEWTGPERVCFTLTGLNESVDGGGTLVMSPAVAAPPPPPPRLGLVARFFRWLFSLLHGNAPDRAALPAGALGGEATMLTFTLRMDAGGPTGPLVNAMLGPALLPAAEDLANKIAAHLEQASGLQAGRAA
jgi:carbon monoxide dehydrogenase subunit G